MKAKLTVANAKSSEIKELMAIAASAGSDNGLSPNYFSVPSPIIEPKTIRGGAKPYAAFVTLLFNPETLEFVKIGSVSVRGVQRTANVCESDTLPENCTLEMIRKMPQVEIIAGSSRQNGKSAYETIETWWKGKRVIAPIEQKNCVNIGFDANGQPTIEGTTVRKRWLFEAKVNEKIYEKVGEVLKELYDASQDENLKSHFDAANIELPFTR